MAGLGLKRKNSEKESGAKKAKTLQDKREALEADMMRYGREAVEKMYPKQSSSGNSGGGRASSSGGGGKRHGFGGGHHRHGGGGGYGKGSPIKMRPKPSGLDFEEVDARKILRPLSHSKYIYEPPNDSVVYIARRNGLVPLSSLCKDSKTVLSSNARLLQGRNVRLGKPRLYIRDRSSARLVAIGGSRTKTFANCRVVRVPARKKEKPPGASSMAPFEVDGEMARFAAEALTIPSRAPRVDVRSIKRRERAAKKLTEELEFAKPTEKNIVAYMLNKIKQSEKVKEQPAAGQQQESGEASGGTCSPVENERGGSSSPTDTKAAEHRDDETPAPATRKEKTTDGDSSDDEVEYNSSGKVFNKWSDEAVVSVNVHEIESRAIWTDEFRAKMEERKKNPIAGVDECDVEGCFCKEEEEQEEQGGIGTATAAQSVASLSAVNTEAQTPVSGAQTPSAGAQEDSLKKGSEKKTRTKLNKVKRALKTLGVNFLEFDDSDGSAQRSRDCPKESCRLGCICDAIASKPVPPAHCGKVECMFKCFCSEDAVKFASSRKVGISPVGAANLRSSSQRNMAAEERKFHNTVVATSSGQDLFMLGSTGRQKRERKVPSRYQDSSASVMDNVGKDYSDKSTSGDVNDYTKIDPINERILAEGINSDIIQKCTVLVPMVNLPDDTLAWCMYHCQYSCPCEKFKNPLDYAPDRNQAPSQGRATGKGKKVGFLNRPRPKSVKIREVNHSARTAGIIFTPSNRLKMPHRIVSSVSELSIKPCPKSKKLEKLAMLAQEGVPSKTRALKPKKVADPAEGALPPFSLSMQTKGSVQYVGWNIMKQELGNSTINVYCFMRSSRPVVFVAKAREAPYVTSAENIKQLHPSRFSSLPPTIESLLTPVCNEDLTKYAILTHNGIAWEITGVLQKKKPRTEGGGEETPLAPKSFVQEAPQMPGLKPIAPVVQQQPQQQKQQQEAQQQVHQQQQQQAQDDHDQQQSAHVIRADTKVMKLPPGQSLVTMQRQGRQTMQIKLPPTTPTQHWCTIRVDNAEGSIQCPDSSMALKCNVLKQAANLSMKEDTTVRIPIAVPGEVSSFGVYAVPGLSTHVFVGPFSSKQSAGGGAEVINIDSPPPPPLPPSASSKEGEEDDDDVQVLSSPPATSSGASSNEAAAAAIPSGEVVGGLVDSISDRAVSVCERKKRREAFRSRAVTGQVPQVVQKGEERSEHEVITIDSDEEDEGEGDEKKPQAQTLKEHQEVKKVPYINLPSSDHGKIVMKAAGGAVSVVREDASCVRLKGERVEVRATIKSNGIVTFPHPTIPNHDVFCGSVDDASSWLREYEKTAKKEEEKDRSSSKSSSLSDKKKDEESNKSEFKLHVKPMSTLLASVPGKTDPRSGAIRKTQEVLHPDGRKGYAIFLDRQNQQELTKLFYDLGNETFATFFQKNVSRLQILQKAKEEALMLQKQEKELEEAKKELVAKRQRLFEQFTESLKGLPVNVKKQKLLELKNLVKRKDHHPGNTSSPNVQSSEKHQTGPLSTPEPSGQGAPSFPAVAHSPAAAERTAASSPMGQPILLQPPTLPNVSAPLPDKVITIIE